jgi:hypothetical protein
VAGVEGMPGRRRAVEIAARGVEADAPPSKERGWRRRGGRTATGGRRWPPRERRETGKEARRTRERREAAASVGGRRWRRWGRVWGEGVGRLAQ